MTAPRSHERLLAFELAGGLYALPIACVVEVGEVEPLACVPTLPPALGGVMNDSARAALNSWLLDYAREEPVYRLDDSTFGRIASRRIQRVDIDSGLITLRMD